MSRLETRKEDTHKQRDAKMLEKEGKSGEHISVGGGRSVAANFRENRSLLF